MNKKNKILVGCLALLLTLSAGYALFSDTITINGTATAKGDFDIVLSCYSGLAEGADYEVLGIPSEGGYENDICTVSDDVVTYSVDLLYPGAARYFTVKATNNGSITSTVPTELTLAEPTKVCYSNDMNAEPESGNCYTENSGGSYAYAMQKGDGTIYSGESVPEEVLSEFTDAEGNLILKPGNSVYYCVGGLVDEQITGNVLNMKIVSSYTGTFNQVTQ